MKTSKNMVNSLKCAAEFIKLKEDNKLTMGEKLKEKGDRYHKGEKYVSIVEVHERQNCLAPRSQHRGSALSGKHFVSKPAQKESGLLTLLSIIG